MKRKIQNLVTRNQNLIEENLRLKKEIKLVKSPKHRKSVATAEFKKYFSASQTKSIMTGKRVVWSKKDIVSIRSMNHQLYTLNQPKIALTSFYDKCILLNEVDLVPFGYAGNSICYT